MPATETLLKKLNETLGEQATSDLVTWVDHSSARDIAQLRELAELHYGRFDARLDQRLAEVAGSLRTEMAHGHAALRTETAQGLAALRTEMAQGLAAVRVEMGSLRGDLMKWMFIYWMGTIVPLSGLMVALVKLVT